MHSYCNRQYSLRYYCTYSSLVRHQLDYGVSRRKPKFHQVLPGKESERQYFRAGGCCTLRNAQDANVCGVVRSCWLLQLNK